MRALTWGGPGRALALGARLGLLLAWAGAAGCGGAQANGAGKKSGDAGPDPFANAVTRGDGAAVPVSARDGGGGSRDGSVMLAQLPSCGASRFGASPMQVNVLLVIDKSGSMNDTPAGFDSNKWAAMKASLAASLQPVQDQLWLGLELYPLDHCEMPTGSTIEVDVQAGAQALPAIETALDASQPSGGTPTAAALERALQYFTSGGGKDLSGGKYVLLATDGGPNCNTGLTCSADACTVNLDGQCPAAVANCCDAAMAGSGAEGGCLDDQATLSEIKALSDAGIDTFVVGIPGSESYGSTLDALAQAGGRANPAAPPSYYAVSSSGSDVGGLTSVLDSITSSLIKSCRLQLESTPPSLELLNVQVDDQLVLQSGPDGWDLDTSSDPPTIELKGATCSRIESDGVQSVSVLYGCPTQIK